MQIHFQQTLSQQIRLTMTPSLQQAIQILHFSTAELVEYIQEQVIENPLLEVEGLDRWLEWIRGERLPSSAIQNTEKDRWEPRVSEEMSLAEYLQRQLAFASLSAKEEEVCLFLIGCLDERGYLDVSEQEVCKRFSLSSEEWSRCLQVVQSLEPAGVGARSLEECLLLQLQREQSPSAIAIEIVEKHLTTLGKGRLDQIARQLKVERKEVKRAMQQIQRCHPRPGAYFSVTPTQYVVPDVWVEKVGSAYQVREMPQSVPPLKINHYYRQMAKKRTELPSEAVQYLRRSIAAALHLQRGIEQRHQTVQRVAELIVKHQQSFFEQGLSGLRPLSLKQIAVEADLHESTVSRATRHKYMQTPKGLYPFRFFFPQGLFTSNGQAVSHHVAKEKMKRILRQENRRHPLSDQKIATVMRDHGIQISRRTVAKYREEMGIPSSTQRRAMNGF